MKTTFYPASGRGHVNLGWLESRHSFSFGHWYDPGKVHFGALRVLNDDIVKGGGGFQTHPHDNMEIVSIPLQGALTHRDSMGTDGVIKAGDVQIMSAGTGVRHSEFNASKTESVNFLQIWIFPKVQDIKPHYDQKTFDAIDRKNKWQILVSPEVKEGGVWINQDARFAMTDLEAGKELVFTPSFKESGVYVFVLDGEITIGDQILGKRDALGILETEGFGVHALQSSQILAIEIPANVN
jgi:redox-sensitive bicupin YhaK (pirin superfamily)